MGSSDNDATAAGGERALDLGPLAGFIGFALRNAQESSFRAFARLDETSGLKPGRFAALMVIRHNPGLTQRELGAAIARDKSTVTPLIQDLLRLGLIARSPSKEDRRRNSLRLTAKGEATLAELEKHAREHDDRLDAIVGQHKALFLELLHRVAREI